ncbi:MAG: hypothetical protein WCO98_17485, partial [bacterium]
YILHCNRDGTQPVLDIGGHALQNATANAQGIIAAAHAHFSKDVTLFDADFNTLSRYTRIGDYNFTSPAEIAVGLSGDFYVLDQGRDQVIRFHPDGIRCAVYQIPHEEYQDKRFGYLTRFRVCEQTKSLYVVDWQNLRCFSMDSPEFQFTLKMKWEIKSAGTCMNLSYGYGGFDLDEKGILYTIGPLNEEFITSYDADGKLLKKIPLKMDDHKPIDPERVLGLCVSKNEVFVKRQHKTELFLRFNIDTGEIITDAAVPTDFDAILRNPTADGGKPIAPVVSTMGIPADRKSIRVLFVGNSQVNCVRDIPEMVEEISRSSNNKKLPIILTDEVVVGGTGLEGYWKNGLAQKKIAAGGWDYVVINDIVYSFGITSTAKFNEYAGKFDEIIKKSGGKTMIFSTGDVDKKRDQQVKMYQDAISFAKNNKCRVAGAGMAWLKAWDKDPTLDFHFTDRAHPNALGCYFNSCVIYAALTDSNPAEQEIATCNATDKEQAALLQKIAWEQYQEDRKNEK